MFLSNYHLLQFCHKLPQFSQNDPTFGGYDDFWPFLAKKFLKSIFLLQQGKFRTLLNPEFLSH